MLLSGYPSFLSLANANINKDNYLKFLNILNFLLVIPKINCPIIY